MITRSRTRQLILESIMPDQIADEISPNVPRCTTQKIPYLDQVPIFKNDKTYTIRQFLINIDEVIEFGGFDFATTKAFISFRVSPDIKTAITRLPEYSNATSWPVLRKALEKRFIPSNTISSIRQTFYGAKQKPQESGRDFADRILNLADQLKSSYAEDDNREVLQSDVSQQAVGIFVNGLNGHYASLLRLKDPATISEAVEYYNLLVVGTDNDKTASTEAESGIKNISIGSDIIANLFSKIKLLDDKIAQNNAKSSEEIKSEIAIKKEDTDFKVHFANRPNQFRQFRDSRNVRPFPNQAYQNHRQNSYYAPDDRYRYRSFNPFPRNQYSQDTGRNFNQRYSNDRQPRYNNDRFRANRYMGQQFNPGRSNNFQQYQGRYQNSGMRNPVYQQRMRMGNPTRNGAFYNDFPEMSYRDAVVHDGQRAIMPPPQISEIRDEQQKNV